MQHTELDHLVIVADTLAQGAAWCEHTLGVAPVAGGQHVLMGTHNLLLNISSETCARAYLEIIAIDPEVATGAAPTPTRARWFNMDDPAQQARVRATGPELVAYVARSAMAGMHRWGLINSGVVPGEMVSASRQTAHGLLQWQIVLTDDGRLLAGGAIPTLIQWQGAHPADALPASGVGVGALTVRGLPDQVAQVLRLRPLRREALPGAAIEATLSRPDGRVVTLRSTPA